MTIYCATCLPTKEATAAVTVWDGHALCRRHFAEVLQRFNAQVLPDFTDQDWLDNIDVGLQSPFDENGKPVDAQ